MAIELALFNGKDESNFPGYRRKVLGVDASWWTLTRKRLCRVEGSAIRFYPSLEGGEGRSDALEQFNYTHPFIVNGVGLFLHDKKLPRGERMLLAYGSLGDICIHRAGELVELTPSFELETDNPRLLTDVGARAFAAIAWALSCHEGAMDFNPEFLNKVNQAARRRLDSAPSPCSL